MDSNLFQFQYGTIERSIRQHRYDRAIDISIPVWYDWKGIENVLDNKFLKEFQFQYGTIERGGRFLVTTLVNYFNSSMVRLKDGNLQIDGNAYATFQFQYGTIESHNPSMNKSIYLISIPVWYDWKMAIFK